MSCNVTLIQVDLAWDVGHRSGARTASENAKKWAIGAIVTGVSIAAVVTVSLAIYFGAAFGVVAGAANS